MIGENQWADYADSFDSLDEYSHFLPALFDLLGDVEARHVLDLGCSNGVMSRLLAMGGANMTGIDISEHAITIAESLTRASGMDASFKVADANNLSIFPDSTFDLVLSINTLCSFGTDRGAMHDIAGEIHRVLRAGGSLVSVVPHPAFEHRQKCRTRQRSFPENYSYFDGGTENTLRLTIGQNRAEFTNVHWSLQDYSEFFRGRFMISDIREPEPDEKFDRLHPAMFESESRYPIYLMLKWVKQSLPPTR